MGVCTWGKVKFSEMPIELKNFELNDILVSYDCLDEYGLHVSPLEKNELFFDIFCDKLYQEKSDNDDFFSLDMKSDKDFSQKKKELFQRLYKLQLVLEKIFALPKVIEMTFFNSEMGTPCLLSDYKTENWQINNFALEFFNAMDKNGMFTPTIKVKFVK